MVKVNTLHLTDILKEVLNSEEHTVDIKLYKDVNAVIASIGNQKVGALRVKPFESYYQVDSAMVKPEFRNLGIGKEMYRVAFESLGSLYSDSHQTSDAEKIWKSFINSGEAESIGKRYKMV